MNKHLLNPIISFIVPAYNCDKYIEKCVTSILKQTINEIEIIIINDGSSDKTKHIIDELAKQDFRVRPIHKKNEGVSIARNIGIQEANGKYVVFVDADDYISGDYAEYMLNLIRKNNGEFAFTTKCYVADGEDQTNNDVIRVISSEEATALLLSPSVIVGCWNKIYSLKFIRQNNLQFSTDLFYGEGLSFIITMSQMAKKIVIGNKKVYYYRRNNEMSATTRFDIEKLRNGERALIKIKNDISKKSETIDAMWRLHISLFSLGAITRMETNNVKRLYEKDYIHWRNIVKNNLLFLLSRRDISLYRKILLLLGYISPKLVGKLDVLRRRKIASNSVK
ncbi:glycosyltransferase family 2 protein [Globicatella sanguinis]